jgi:hypothetical protein
MFRKPIFVAVLVLALVSMACGINIQMPVKQVKTGPTQTDKISLAAPDAKTAYLTLGFGAGSLTLSPGEGKELVSGTATYNVSDFKPKITENGDEIKIEQGDLNIDGIPSFEGNVQNEWDLKLSTAPLELTINAGAYVGKYELGGLSIKDLKISDGAAEGHLSFSKPNLVEMSNFEYSTGASDVTLTGLANANFANLIFKSGAGSYTLDFTGDLKRDADVSVESGISSVTIVVPQGMSAEVKFEGGLSNVTLHGNWKQNGNNYVQSGTGPLLKISVKMGAGNLDLRNP